MPIKKLPQPGVGDHAYTVVKAAVSAIPGVGGSAAELMGLVIAPPLVKRRDEWLVSIAQGLQDLEARVAGFSIGAVASNDVFITAVLHATAVAVKNHQKEKLAALRNAVLNAALPNSPNADLQLLFLRWVDSLTPMHIGLLSLLSNPETWQYSELPNNLPGAMGTVKNVMYLGYPALYAQGTVADKVMNDIASEGLVGNPSAHQVDGCIVLAPRVTELGMNFLAFISEPASIK